jgi:hypothetical protein
VAALRVQAIQSLATCGAGVLKTRRVLGVVRANRRAHRADSGPDLVASRSAADHQNRNRDQSEHEPSSLHWYPTVATSDLQLGTTVDQ